MGLRLIAILTAVLAVTAALAAASSARSWNRSDARYVEYHLASDWTTSDGVAIDTAFCTPWWGHQGHFVWEYNEWFGSAWNCTEHDVDSRTFWDHVRVNGGGGLAVWEYRCRPSYYACP